MTTFSVAATRRNGEQKTFTGKTNAEAFDAAFAWMDAERNVIAAAANLIEQLRDVREMLEETNEGGKTAEAFAALETAIRLANTN